MNARTLVHDIVDHLSDDELKMAKQLLDRLRSTSVDPMLKVLASAPYDDESTSPEEDQSAKQAWEQRDQAITSEEARRRYLS